MLKTQNVEEDFETEMWVKSIRLALNHLVQETIANVMIGFLRALKQAEGESLARIEIGIKKLPRQVEVDAHFYPWHSSQTAQVERPLFSHFGDLLSF